MDEHIKSSCVQSSIECHPASCFSVQARQRLEMGRLMEPEVRTKGRHHNFGQKSGRRGCTEGSFCTIKMGNVNKLMCENPVWWAVYQAEAKHHIQSYHDWRESRGYEKALGWFDRPERIVYILYMENLLKSLHESQPSRMMRTRESVQFHELETKEIIT